MIVTKLVMALARVVGGTGMIVMAFGFFNYVGLYFPGVGEPVSLYVVAWVAAMASFRWPTDAEYEANEARWEAKRRRLGW